MAEVNFSVRKGALQTINRTSSNRILPLVITCTYNPASPNLTKILMKHWHLISDNPKLAQIFSDSPIVACRKDKSLKNFLVRAKIPSQTKTTKTGVIHGKEGDNIRNWTYSSISLDERQIKDIEAAGWVFFLFLTYLGRSKILCSQGSVPSASEFLFHVAFACLFEPSVVPLGDVLRYNFASVHYPFGDPLRYLLACSFLLSAAFFPFAVYINPVLYLLHLLCC